MLDQDRWTIALRKGPLTPTDFWAGLAQLDQTAHPVEERVRVSLLGDNIDLSWGIFDV